MVPPMQLQTREPPQHNDHETHPNEDEVTRKDGENANGGLNSEDRSPTHQEKPVVHHAGQLEEGSMMNARFDDLQAKYDEVA